jgi:folate-dependent phosphoribosylglycinamide formyltransferase PurN
LYREYYTRDHNSPECRRVLEEEGVDVLVLSTDAIISHRILRIPRVVTLNVHPGWIPQYRGLGSNMFQMEQGKLPAVSVHAVDEGIDTGPLIVREWVRVDPRIGLTRIEDEVDKRGHQLLAEVIRQAEKGAVRYTDTFDEPSGMTRGMSARKRKRLDARLREGSLALS